MAWSKEPDNVVASTMARAATLAALLAALGSQAGAEGIYTCTDAKGRRLTADRPIIDCIDREQTELSSSGLPRRKIGPVLTAAERAAEEDKARALDEERIRAGEEKRRERALVTRYPNRGVHDKERETALAMVDSVSAASNKRTTELLGQRRFLENEVEFYKFEPSRTPPKVRRQLEEVDAHLNAQKRFLADQEVEKVRVNARFDEELSRLKVLWAQQGALATSPVRPAPAPVAAAKPASSAKPVR